MNNISLTDLNWIAGFLEGEGTFNRCGGTIQVSASQVQREPLERLIKFIGYGNIRKFYRNSNRESQNDYYRFSLYGKNAELLMKMIFGLMSPRRKWQINKCLSWYETRPGTNFVKSGRTKWRKCNHPYTEENTYVYPSRGTRVCKICKLAYQRNFYHDHKFLPKRDLVNNLLTNINN